MIAGIIIGTLLLYSVLISMAYNKLIDEEKETKRENLLYQKDILECDRVNNILRQRVWFWKNKYNSKNGN